MIKSDMGRIEIEGRKDIILAETAVLLKDLRSVLSDRYTVKAADDLLGKAFEVSKLDKEEIVKELDNLMKEGWK